MKNKKNKRNMWFKIKAIQLKLNNIEEVYDFIGEGCNWPNCKIGGIDPKDGKFKLKIKNVYNEDVIGYYFLIKVGDWIIKTKNGMFYPLWKGCIKDFVNDVKY
jgi:hypothetical protein